MSCAIGFVIIGVFVVHSVLFCSRAVPELAGELIGALDDVLCQGGVPVEVKVTNRAKCRDGRRHPPGMIVYRGAEAINAGCQTSACTGDSVEANIFSCLFEQFANRAQGFLRVCGFARQRCFKFVLYRE